MNEIKRNERLDSLFSKEDPDEITEILINEMNEIIERIAPVKVVQRKSNEKNYDNKETAEFRKETEAQLEKAIRLNEIEEWRIFRSMRNQLLKWMKNVYSQRMERKMNDKRTMWNQFKNVVNPNKGSIPTCIITENKQETSPAKISNMMNNFFMEKIEKIRKNFGERRNSNLSYLELLIGKPNTQFHLPEITIKETYEIITNMKTTNSSGFDNTNSRIIKEILHITALYMTHLINSVIRKGKFPDLLKITKIIPLCKPNKPVTMTTSYRPIAIMNVYEKMVEAWMKVNLMKYFEENNLILKNHHGARANHSTMSAKLIIDHHCKKSMDSNKFGVILSSNLSSAYDVVPHDALIEKLE